MPNFDYVAGIKRIPTQVEPLDEEADVPIRHYRRLANDAFSLLAYVDRNLARAGKTYEAPRERHRRHLCRLVLVDLVEAFERFLKELAAVCVDHVSPLVADSRFDIFPVPKSVALAQHFAARTWGRALCESATWLDCGDANDRFRRILADPFTKGDFYVFPMSKGQQPAALAGRHELVTLVFQLRNAAVHNAGVITESDAAKLRVLSRGPVEAPRLLVPSRLDVYSVKLYLDETAKLINAEVATRLAMLLETKLRAADLGYDVPAQAKRLAVAFNQPITMGAVTATP